MIARTSFVAVCRSSVSRSASWSRFRASDDAIRAWRIAGSTVGEVVGGAHLEAADDAVELVDAGDHDDRQVRERRVALSAARVS